MGGTAEKGNSGETHLAKPRSAIETCFFDLDDTLYPKSTGLADECKKRIEEYMVQKLAFNPSTVDAENLRLYRRYGTTMAGLRAEGYSFSFDDWHNHVHVPLPYDAIRPDLTLRSALHSMPQRKFVLTNGDQGHAARCFSRLGVEDCLHGILCFEDIMAAPPVLPFCCRDVLLGEDCQGELHTGDSKIDGEATAASWSSTAGPQVCCKPQAEAFRRALLLAGADASSSAMFDDSASNIVGAKRVGMKTVLVGSSNHIPAADYCVVNLHNMHGLMPELRGVVAVQGMSCPCGVNSQVQAVIA